MRLSTTTLVEDVAKLHKELPKCVTRKIVKDFIVVLGSNLKQNNDIRLDGIGVFRIRDRAARAGRNPQTGEPITIKACKKVTFRPAVGLKPLEKKSKGKKKA